MKKEKSDKKRRNFYLKPEVHTFLKLEAKERGCSMGFIVSLLVEEYMRSKYFNEE